jgi:hypothetical protein
MWQQTLDPRSIQLPGFVFKRRAVSRKQKRFVGRGHGHGRELNVIRVNDLPGRQPFSAYARRCRLSAYRSDQVRKAVIGTQRSWYQ